MRGLGVHRGHEATQLSGEFQHWREEARDEKVHRLALLLDRDDMLFVYSGISLRVHQQLDDLQRKVFGDRMRHEENHPYLLAHGMMMSVIGTAMQVHRIDGKCEVVFDEQNVFRQDAKRLYKEAVLVARPELRQHLPDEPYFRDDKEFVILQAADLLVGNARMTIEGTRPWPELPFSKLRTSKFSAYLDGETVLRILEHMVYVDKVISLDQLRDATR